MTTLTEEPDSVWQRVIAARFGTYIDALVPDAPDPAPPHFADPHDDDRPDRITVPAFARAVGVSTHAAYRLLVKGLVPGAFKTDPSAAKSHYFIPADAPARFLAQGER